MENVWWLPFTPQEAFPVFPGAKTGAKCQQVTIKMHQKKQAEMSYQYVKMLKKKADAAASTMKQQWQLHMLRNLKMFLWKLMLDYWLPDWWWPTCTYMRWLASLSWKSIGSYWEFNSHWVFYYCSFFLTKLSLANNKEKYRTIMKWLTS